MAEYILIYDVDCTHNMHNAGIHVVSTVAIILDGDCVYKVGTANVLPTYEYFF